MLKINRYIILLVLWLSFLFNIERLNFNQTQSGDLDPRLYGLAILFTLLGLGVPYRLSLQTWHMQMFAGFVYLATRLDTLQTLAMNQDLYLILFELIALLITITLAHAVGRLGVDFVDTARSLVLSDTSGHVYTPEQAQTRIKHEMHYARRADQPLSIIVMEADAQNARVQLHATAREIERLLIKRYSTIALLRLLALRSRRTDFFLDHYETGRMVLVTPRAGKEELPVIIDRLNQLAYHHLGVRLRFGVASFPQEGLTFEELLYQAEENLRSAQPAIEPREEEIPQSNPQPTNGHMVVKT